ncbi:MAG: hypothetical protein U5L11_17335 [Arhodomonas sp.]|nr:hypothetical protein [Arhodomonas sp.]
MSTAAAPTLHWAVVPTDLGPLLVATTVAGIAAVAFDPPPEAAIPPRLRARFPDLEVPARPEPALPVASAVAELVTAPRARTPPAAAPRAPTSSAGFGPPCRPSHRAPP